MQLNSLTVLREVLYSDLLSPLGGLLAGLEDEDRADQAFAAAEFCRAVYLAGGDLGESVLDLALSGEGDLYLQAVLEGKTPSVWLTEALERDLAVLGRVAALRPADVLLPEMDCEWGNTPVDLPSAYKQMIDELGTRGYGIFRKNIMFTVRDEEIIPVPDPSFKPLELFYGYKRERGEVLRNTEVLAEGGHASNVLLYGDAGTGKSSTVKAAAAAFADKGVRLIEFRKSQASEIPAVAAKLRHSPLKFIFYIDDLSFTDNDDDFYCLKGILEGNVSGQPANTVIYATSNRRHLVRESMEDRQGDDIHLNDTLQELMSVSARFGLTITFQKPAKDLYLEIVRDLADEYGVAYDSEEDLFKRAEAFAIRANGRSPRTAKQFIMLASAGMR